MYLRGFTLGEKIRLIFDEFLYLTTDGRFFFFFFWREKKRRTFLLSLGAERYLHTKVCADYDTERERERERDCIRKRPRVNDFTLCLLGVVSIMCLVVLKGLLSQLV